MSKRRASFGALVRRERMARGVGLRELAGRIGVSPTYLSRVERDGLAPPAEDKVRRIAAIIEQDVDELLALAGRVSSDLSEIIRRQPRETAALLRSVEGLSAAQVARLSREAEREKRERSSSFARTPKMDMGVGIDDHRVPPEAED